MITRTHILTVLLATIILTFPSPAQDHPEHPDNAEHPSTPELIPGISNTRTARCLVSVDGVDRGKLVALLQTSAVAGLAATETLGVSDPLDQGISINTDTTLAINRSSKSRLGRPVDRDTKIRDELVVTVKLPEDLKPAAEEFLAALCQNLQKELLEAHSHKDDELREKLALAKQQQSKTRQAWEKLVAEHQAILEQAGRSTLSHGDLEKHMVNLEMSIAEVASGLAQEKAKREALERMIAERRENLQRQLSEDPIAQHLAEMVDIRRLEVARWEGMPPPPAPATQNLPPAIQKKIPLDFVETELRQVINDIKEKTGLNIIVYWPELEAAEILPDDLISIQSGPVSADDAIKHVLAFASLGKYDTVKHTVDADGTVLIRAGENSDTVVKKAAIPRARGVGSRSVRRTLQNPAHMLTDARIALAQARLEFAQRQQEVKDAITGEAFTKLNAQLDEVTMEIINQEAALKASSDELNQMKEKNLLVLADQLARVAQDKASARKAYDHAVSHVDSCQREVASRMLVPKVTVMGAK